MSFNLLSSAQTGKILQLIHSKISRTKKSVVQVEAEKGWVQNGDHLHADRSN